MTPHNFQKTIKATQTALSFPSVMIVKLERTQSIAQQNKDQHKTTIPILLSLERLGSYGHIVKSFITCIRKMRWDPTISLRKNRFFVTIMQDNIVTNGQTFHSRPFSSIHCI